MPLDFKRFGNIEDKVFLVTGGAVRVGAGLVRTLLLENARYVAFLDIADREGNILETELLSKFSALRAKFIKCDISDETQLAAAFKQVFDKYRRLDVVINNAAVLGADNTDFRKIVNINFADIFYSKTRVRVLTICLGPTDTAIIQKINISNFNKDYTPNLMFRAPARQKVESAANGILEVFNKGETSSTWVVADDKPPIDISKNVLEGFEAMLQDIKFT